MREDENGSNWHAIKRQPIYSSELRQADDDVDYVVQLGRIVNTSDFITF